ncbi:CvpA family protein [secondary endosymbiont of Ctenarytaina eucalypti]|uniref:Putative membrane protein, required for colicin V production n=1 Tax=secondary endosymbiont of Ctenarytaina eucalypti TaxID=1199245 RepID=J3TFI7_9ENTR|nr:CvpA family protein [secondary endosymbiont of Ctenarytaina eucalypti]AFP85002.1 putative membrane protein, required for colicin V production [secondary endosymbiont of Ctenarytaina eucalypti]
MIWVDYVIISIIIFSALVSVFRGFVCEALSLVTWGCAFFVTSHYYGDLAIHFSSFKAQMVRNSIAIVIIFILVLLVGSILQYLLNFLVERGGLSGTDRELGVCFGILRGIFIVTAGLFFLNHFTGFSNSQDWQQSQLIPMFRNIIRWFFGYP